MKLLGYTRRQQLIQWIRSLLPSQMWDAHLPSPATTLGKGDTGEILAYHYLREQGYRVVTRKYRRPFGEIDLIGWEKDVLCFIEVKLRLQLDYGRPEEAVNRKKRRQICRVAREYRKRYKLHDINYRYDIVCISGSLERPELRLIRGAFSERP